MAIQRLRDGSEGILAKIIVGLIMVVFALFGFGSITTFLAPVPKVATVNGTDITQQDMEVAVERNRRMLLARNTTNIDEDELRTSSLTSLITREVMDQLTEKLDLFFGDELIDEEIVSAEVFQIGGVFNPDQFQMVIGGAGYSPLTYREEMRTDKKFQQINSGIQGSSFITDAEAVRYTGLVRQTRDLAYLRIEVDDLLAKVEISEEEIGSYYQENLPRFVTKETVSLEYLELTLDDIAARVSVNEDDLIAYYEETKSMYTTDEKRRVSHILVEVTDEVSEAAAKEKIDKVYGEIIDGGDFSKLAKQYSDDTGSAENGGDLGVNAPGTFVPEFEAVAYDLGTNEVSKPVLSEFGYHIIKVTGIEPSVTSTLDEVRTQVETAYRRAIAEDEFVSSTAKFGELVFESIDLQVPAAELGLTRKTTGKLQRDSGEGLLANEDVAAAVFSPDVLVDGNNSDVIEVSADHRLAVRVVDHTPSATRSLADVTEDIRYILMRKKANELAEGQAKDIVSEIEGGSLARFVADKYGLVWQVADNVARTSKEVDGFVLRKAFELARPPEGKETVGFAQLPDGDAVVLLVSSVINQDVAEMPEAERTSLAMVLSNQIGAMNFSELQSAMVEMADVVRSK